MRYALVPGEVATTPATSSLKLVGMKGGLWGLWPVRISIGSRVPFRLVGPRHMRRRRRSRPNIICSGEPLLQHWPGGAAQPAIPRTGLDSVARWLDAASRSATGMGLGSARRCRASAVDHAPVGANALQNSSSRSTRPRNHVASRWLPRSSTGPSMAARLERDDMTT